MPRSLLRRRSTAPAFAVAVLLFLAGCQTYTEQSYSFSEAWKSADLSRAVDAVSKKADDHRNDRDTVIWSLEKGAVLRTAALAGLAPADGTTPAAATGPATGENPWLSQSNGAFAVAQAKILNYEEGARFKLGSEALAALTNQANQPYRGHGYDKVMLHTYLAANHIGLHDPAAARVEFNRLLQTQRDLVADNAKRIDRTREEAAEGRFGSNGKPGYDVDAALRDPRVSSDVDDVESDLRAQLRGYEDYVNPFSVWLDGLFFATNAEGPSDFERARKSIERASAMSPGNPYLKDDLALANLLHLGKSFDGLTYVIFETGSAPHLEEWRIDLPIFVVTDRLSYVGAALPRLRFDNNFTDSLTVAADGATYPTALVSSMDSVIAQDFHNEWPALLTRTILSVAVKATADAALQNQVKDQGIYAQIAAQAFAAITASATTVADTRSWTTLPKQFQYCRFPTPKDGRISLRIGAETREITLEKGSVNLVWVKNIGANLPTYVSQSVLKN